MTKLEQIEEELQDYGNRINEYSKLIDDLECNYQIDDPLIGHFLKLLKVELYFTELAAERAEHDWDLYNNE